MNPKWMSTNDSSLLARLRRGLGRSATYLSFGLGAGEKLGTVLSSSHLRSLERSLLKADLGPTSSRHILARLQEKRFSKAEAELQGEALSNKIREIITEIIAEELHPYARPLAIEPAHRPHVVVMHGVNGSGKTTSLGKLAALERQRGRSVLLAAADNFRAAAVEQLQIWAKRAGVDIEVGKVGLEAAAVAYRALRRAQEEEVDLLLVDTAGRLQNRQDLMAETEKMLKVLRKLDTNAPHDSLLVLDATTGQNALSQVNIFHSRAEISGLIVTKLDGAARGGILLALCEQSSLPIHYIGLGEGLEDLYPFDAEIFARALIMREAA